MARKATSRSAAAKPAASARQTKPEAIASTPVRHTPIPKPQSIAAAAPEPTVEITHDAIARRAFEISQSPGSGSECNNWIRAERELRGAI